MPEEPWWPNFSELWTVGFLTHFLVVLSGYLASLWLWQRGQKQREVPAHRSTTWNIVFSLVTAFVIVTLDGLITNGLFLQIYPGITFFVQHFLIAFIFLYIWQSLIGFHRHGLFIAAILLSLLWTTYGIYVSPIGLPSSSLQFLSYSDLWLKSFPGSLASILIGFWFAYRFLPGEISFGQVMIKLLSILFIALLLPTTTQAIANLGVSAITSGQARMMTGADPYNLSNFQLATGSIQVEAVDSGNRISRLANNDTTNIRANISTQEGNYKISIQKAMDRHPLGRYPVWGGVVLNQEMHGNTGIGTSELPKMQPEASIWGWAEVYKNDNLVSKMAPAHIMINTQGPLKGISLEIDTEDQNLVNIPNNYLFLVWPEINSLDLPTEEQRNRKIAGWLVLFFMNVGWIYAINIEKKYHDW